MNEYEKLIKQGYREEEIDLPLDQISRVSVFDSPMGPGREDKGVIAKDNSGTEKRTSSIMMGYNAKGIQLENGEYVNLTELEQALGEALSKDEENVTYACVKSGKIVEIDDISKDLFDRAMEKAYLSYTPTDKIVNQQAASVTIHDRGQMYPKGLAMLGNDKLQLPSGEYVKEEEIRLAIEDYVMLHEPKKEPVIPPIPTPKPVISTPQEPMFIPKPEPKPEPKEETIEKEEPQKEETYTVIKRIFHKASIIPTVVVTAALILSGFGKTNTTDTIENRSRIQNVGLEATRIQYESEYESADDVLKRTVGGFVTGEQVEVKEGTPYYASSDYEYGGASQNGVFGEGIRSAGSYNVDAFSILKDGHIVECEWDEEKDLISTLEQVAQENSTTINDLEAKIHIGGPVAGWVDVNDLISEDEKTPREIAQHAVLDDSNKIKGAMDNFEGDSITIQNQNEDVTLKIKTDDGEFVHEGDIVIGSDGMEYQIESLNVEDEEIIDYEEVTTGSRLEWNIKNISLAELLGGAAIAAAGTYISSKIPRKEKTEMTSSQIDGLIKTEEKKFIEAEGEFKGVSEFSKATESLIHKQISLPLTPNEVLRNSLIEQEITVENITTMQENSTGGKAK